ncbi:hypothetical protein TNCV_5007851 [Trichonephila clavipes]|nr:hypothetical protein TNCV_5007851 [Trichonephila clavipes]
MNVTRANGLPSLAYSVLIVKDTTKHYIGADECSICGGSKSSRCCGSSGVIFVICDYGSKLRRTENQVRLLPSDVSGNVAVVSFPKGRRGCGCPVVKVSDHGRHVMSSTQYHLRPAIKKGGDKGARYTLNPSRAQTSSRSCGSLESRAPAQIPSSSFDLGSKLRSPSPKAPCS